MGQLGEQCEHLCTRFLLARDSEEIKSVDKEGGLVDRGRGLEGDRGGGTRLQSVVENLDVRYKATIVVPPML